MFLIALVVSVVFLSTLLILNKDNIGVSRHVQASTIPVTGMTCEACADSITQALTKLIGVESVLVDYTKKEAGVSYDTRKLNEDDIKQEIEKAGYGIGEKEVDTLEVVDFRLKYN